MSKLSSFAAFFFSFATRDTGREEGERLRA